MCTVDINPDIKKVLKGKYIDLPSITSNNSATLAFLPYMRMLPNEPRMRSFNSFLINYD